MREPKVSVALSAEEWRFVSDLRALPSSPLRERALTLFNAVLELARDPRCPEVQADGVPCDTPSRSCDQCLHVEEMLETLRRRALEAAPHPGAVR
ncbi:MAG: hypothetical protein ACHQPI_13995 [Thermoanaerobaculia bacterium]